MSFVALRQPPSARPPRRSRRGRVIAAVVAGGLVLTVAACSSGGGGGSSITTATRPSITTTTVSRPSTTASRPSTTSTSEATTTTAAAVTTTSSSTTSSTSTTSTSTTSSTSTSTTAAPTTTTTEAPTTTTTKAPTTTTTQATTTTTASGLGGPETTTESSKVPWLAIGLLAALAVLITVLMLRRRAQRQTWWSEVDALGRQGQALVDLGTAGPASGAPQEQVAHWATLEQRTTELAAGIEAATPGAPDDAAKGALAGLGEAVTAYLAALRTSRTLRIGPPAASADQLAYADAESAQRLANVRGALSRLDVVVAPHR